MHESDNETAPSSAAGEEVTYNSRAERRAALRSTGAKLLTPAVRRWAYGVAAAALGAAAVAGWVPPGTAAAIGPLLLALFYVDETGEPR